MKVEIGDGPDQRSSIETTRQRVKLTVVALIWAAIAIPSCQPINWGWLDSIGYLVAVAAVFYGVFRWAVPHARVLLRNERTSRVLLAITLVTITAGVLIAYKHAHTLQPDHGSDSSQALELGARAIINGQFPYRHHTYLGNPLSPI